MAKARALLQRIPEAVSSSRQSRTLVLQSLEQHVQPVPHTAPVPARHLPASPGISHIPGPPSFPGIGAMWQYLPGGRFYGKDLNEVIKRLKTMYGDVVQEDIVPGLSIVRLFNPNHFADVYKAEGQCPHRVLFGLLSHYNNQHNEGVQGLLTSQSTSWKRLRREVQQPILQPKAVINYANQHVQIANDFVERILTKRDTTDRIGDFLPEIYKYVTEAVGTVCFGRRLGLLDDDNANGERFIRAVGETLTLTQKELQLLPLYRYIPTPTSLRFAAAQDFIRQFSDVQMQLAMRDSGQPNSNQLARHLLYSSNLTQRQISTFLSEFFAAGVDTTGHYLAFALHALAKNPEVQEKLYRDLKGVTDDEISTGALDTIPYLKAFLKESLRVHPVAPGLGRTLQTDAVLAGYHVPAGTNVVMQYDVAGKDPRFVSHPDHFQPDRWLRDSRHTKTLAYLTLPFGFGPRSCPGRRLASQEVGIAITKILQTFRVGFVGGDLSIKMQILNTPDQPLHFAFAERSK